MSQFTANKSHVDDAFYFDMKQVCAGYSGAAKVSCDGVAWSYYQAVKQFGSLNVTQSQIDQIRENAERTTQNAGA